MAKQASQRTKKARQNQHLMRQNRALNQAKKRKASIYVVERIRRHIDATEAGENPTSHPKRQGFQADARAALQAAREKRRGRESAANKARGRVNVEKAPQKAAKGH